MEPITAESLRRANAKSRHLRELIRAPQILVMPGAYDVLSAQLFEHLGFAAVQVTSGGLAAVLGYPDGEVIGRERAAEVTGRIAQAVSVPVNADGEKGYGDCRHVAETVRALVAAGSAGMNLEDSAPRRSREPLRLVDTREQLEKIAAALETRRSLGSEFFLNARVDALTVLGGDPRGALEEAVRRGNAYAEAGADCIFYMNAVESNTISRLVREVRAPVSILAGEETPGVPELQELGVARVSYGSAFCRAAVSAARRLALEIREHGTVTALRDAMSLVEMRALVEPGR